MALKTSKWLLAALIGVTLFPVLALPESVYLSGLNKYATGTDLGGGHYGLDISGTISATNPSVGTNTSTAPTSSTEIGLIDGTGKLQGVSSTNPLPITGTISASNPSVSTTGAAVPTSATMVGGSDGTNLKALKVSTTGVLSVDGSAVTQPVSISSSVTVAQPTGSNLHVTVDSAPTTAVTGTFWQATQPVSAASLPLPTGAATAAKQPALGTAGTPSSDVITVQGAASMTALKVDGSAVTQPVSAASLPLPTGASTAANQTTANTSLSTIATNTGKQPINTTAAFSQTSVTTTASTISAPANAVKVLIQGDSTNTDCIRYRFDGTAATSTVGMVAQAGQDSGQLDSGMSVSVASCSGTQKVNIQYFAQ
jgi:predicted secreted protein